MARKTHVIVAVNEDEKLQIELAAKSERRSVSNWGRHALLSAARNTILSADQEPKPSSQNDLAGEASYRAAIENLRRRLGMNWTSDGGKNEVD